MAQGNVAGGGAVGAVIGGLMGAVIGWLLGAQMTAIPVIGPLTGSGVLASVIGGLVAGAAIGALIGALVGSASPQDEAPLEQLLESAPDATELTPSAALGTALAQPSAPGAAAIVASTGANDGPDYAFDSSLEADSVFADRSEEITMDDKSDSESGRNPNTFTGTEDAIDPGTGALGTAGTPVTTGYGVSGSTIGTGSERGESLQRQEDFRGATPDTKAYELGGRGSGDREVLHDDERSLPAETRYSDEGREEAPVQRDPANRDIYEKTPGYSESISRGDIPDTVPEGTGTTGVDAEAAQESAGTNLPGTADPRGLGDNTDETR